MKTMSSSCSAAETSELPVEKTQSPQTRGNMDLEYWNSIHAQNEFKTGQVKTCINALKQFNDIPKPQTNWFMNQMKRCIAGNDDEHREAVDELWEIENDPIDSMKNDPTMRARCNTILKNS